MLPELPDVIKQGQFVFDAAKQIDTDAWEDDSDFLRRPDVRHFLRVLMTAYQELKESAAHTDVWCEFKDAAGNLCGGAVDIAVDAHGAYYRCQLDPTHRRAK